MEGRAAERASRAAASSSTIQSCSNSDDEPKKQLIKPAHSKKLSNVGSRIYRSCFVQRSTLQQSGFVISILLVIGMCVWSLARSTLTFMHSTATNPGKRDELITPAQALSSSGEDTLMGFAGAMPAFGGVAAFSSVGCAAAFGMIAAMYRGHKHHSTSAVSSSKSRWSSKSKLRRISSGTLHRNSECTMLRCASYPEVCHHHGQTNALHAPRFSAPRDAELSMWHHVEVHVKSWLDEETGLFRYINEIPRGALQKFEMHTRLAHNVIREDAKGSKRLQAFGQPVPFNYGCFPQTWRDPEETDEIFRAGGDDDPLDVLDLCMETVGVGKVVCCRPLGAVCLIDEGQADWKILAVNTEANDPIASAQSVEDVDRLAPGRIQAVLKWMDDFKKSGKDKGTKLHFKIYDANVAKSIIERDHASWKRLVAAAVQDGTSQGHWIGPLKKELMPQVVSLHWSPQYRVDGRHLPTPSSLVGTTAPSTTMPLAHAMTHRHQSRYRPASSDGGDSSSEMSCASPTSSDTEIGA